MNSFTISQLQNFSGIKAHTIRIWEQRYNALTPQRSEGNTRHYDGNQLRRLLNIVSLMHTDNKVSKLCAMSNDELNNLLNAEYEKLQTGESDTDLYTSQIISAAFDFDEMRFEKLFSNCILRFGLKDTYIKVVYPALLRLGLLWSKDALPPAHEHYIVNLIRQKILTAIEALPPAKDNKDSWLLFLPEDEFHETGLLIAYYLIRLSGKKVFYLGANVPGYSLLQTIETIKPSNILGFLVSKKDKKNELELLNTISQKIKPIKFYLAAEPSVSKQVSEDSDYKLISTVEELESILA